MPRPVVYVVDLDGTLLHDDGRLSLSSRQTLAELLADGAPIAIASARSRASIRSLVAGLDIALPVVECNGSFVTDLASGEHLWLRHLEARVAEGLFQAITAAGHAPFAVTVDAEGDRLYAPPPGNAGMAWYLRDRQQIGDDRLTQVDDVRVCLADRVVSYTVIDAQAPMRRLHGQLEATWDGQVRAHCWNNEYDPGWFWLTVHDHRATKALALRELLALRGLAGAEVIAFGDQVNDVDLLRAADRGIAVANAVPEVKAVADEVIGANTEDSVARYIQADWRARRG